MKLYLILFLFLAVAALPAQPLVSPSHFTTVDGNHKVTSSTNPIGAYGVTKIPYRYLQIHEDLSGTPRVINSMTMRREGTDNYATYSAFSAYIDMYLSTAATTATTPDSTFDNNHGTNKVKTHSFTKVDFPSSAPGPSPYPFTYKIPFATPYSFDGTGPLCWEIRVQATQNTSYIGMDAVRGSSTNPAAINTDFGTGCIASGNTYAMTNATRLTTNWTAGTASFNFSGSYAPPSGLAFFTMGLRTNSFSGLPLPFEIPTSSTGSSGSCYIFNDWFITLPTFASSGGYLTYRLNLNNLTPDLHGVTIYSQVVAADLGANSMGVITSASRAMQMIAPYTAAPVACVDSAGSLGATGTTYSNQGYVVCFE